MKPKGSNKPSQPALGRNKIKTAKGASSFHGNTRK